MSGDRQWTILRPKLGTRQEVTSGPVMAPGEFVDVVEASRLTAVEAERDALRTERDAYREGLEFYGDPTNWDPAPETGWEPAFDNGEQARAVLARFPKNETEQG